MKSKRYRRMADRLIVLLLVMSGTLSGCLAPDDSAPVEPLADVWIQVLGVGQDAGVPQAGSHTHPGWTNPQLQYMATSLGLVHAQSGERWLFEATPDFRRQWFDLDTQSPDPPTSVPDGIFLTHGHMGHYTGLMFLGHESMGSRGVPVYVLPRMAAFLSSNGPWSQLVQFQNIELHVLAPDMPIQLTDDLTVTAFLVPHRQEFTEVAGYRIRGPRRSALFIPDIDSWEEWDDLGVRIEDLLAGVDVAFLDATFFGDGEIPGRDMSGFPHPFISHSMARFAGLSPEEKAKVHFIHLNHSNPVLDPESRQREAVLRAGYRIAVRGDRFEL